MSGHHLHRRAERVVYFDVRCIVIEFAQDVR